MELDKIRGLSDDEIKVQERQAAEQLFRLRFQSKLGQSEGTKKLRSLKLDLARFKTIARERELGIVHAVAAKSAANPAKTVKPVEADEAPVQKKAAAKAPAKKATGAAKKSAKAPAKAKTKGKA
jgi:large subunit ribosomal protein L29